MEGIIAIIDDEPDIVELVSIHLEKSNFKVKKFFNANNFLCTLDKKIYDLVILDLMLPDMDGIDLCKIIKSKNNIPYLPIIMLTAKDDEIDKILGLELGADDYVTKPFSPKELIARVKAVLRRVQKNKEENNENELIINEVLVINPQKYEVKLRGKNIPLTLTEFKILKLLADKPGWAFTRDQLLDYLWGRDKAVIDRTIDVHIKNLREKLGDFGKNIKNVRGVGYKLKL